MSLERPYEEENAEWMRQIRREQLFGVEAILNSQENPATPDTTLALKNAVKTICEENPDKIVGDAKKRSLFYDDIQFSFEPFEITGSFDSMVEETIGTTEAYDVESLFLDYFPETTEDEDSIEVPSRIRISREYGAIIEGISGLIDGPAEVHDVISTHRLTGELIIERTVTEFFQSDESWIQEVSSISVARRLSEDEAQEYLNAVVKALQQDAEIKARKDLEG